MNYFPILIFLISGHCESAKILGIFHLPSPSHHIITGVLFRELAARGHEVVVISPYPSSEKLANYTDIDIEGMLDSKAWLTNDFFNNNDSYFTKIRRIHKDIREYCEYTLASKGLNDLLKMGFILLVLVVTFAVIYWIVAMVWRLMKRTMKIVKTRNKND